MIQRWHICLAGQDTVPCFVKVQEQDDNGILTVLNIRLSTTIYIHLSAHLQSYTLNGKYANTFLLGVRSAGVLFLPFSTFQIIFNGSALFLFLFTETRKQLPDYPPPTHTHHSCKANHSSLSLGFVEGLRRGSSRGIEKQLHNTPRPDIKITAKEFSNSQLYSPWSPFV